MFAKCLESVCRVFLKCLQSDYKAHIHTYIHTHKSYQSSLASLHCERAAVGVDDKGGLGQQQPEWSSKVEWSGVKEW